MLMGDAVHLNVVVCELAGWRYACHFDASELSVKFAAVALVL
jgi:hypothetical protein